MPDTVPADINTNATLTLGIPVVEAIDTLGDHDWYAVTLVAGQTYVFETSSGSSDGFPPDTTLTLHNGNGTPVAFDDDGGPGTFSRLSFTPPYSGTFYIDVGAYNDASIGSYSLVMTQPVPLPVFTNDQIANQLTHGFWGDGSHHFNVVPGGTLDINITALTAEGQSLARLALGLWTDITGITFNEVATGGTITFDDDELGAYCSASYSNGITSSAHVNVSTDWLTTYGTTINTYSMQTYIHEIGHALGLGHGGNYNGSASYPADAHYANDAWVTTVMSYFSPTENSYFGEQGFTHEWIVTPMVADILAANALYGAWAGTRTGNTTYGFNNNSGRSMYDAVLNPTVGYTILDHGGIDTLDYSGFAFNQVVNLNPETFSSIGGQIGNVSIARGTVIENAIGGAGDDSLYGNGIANNLTGGGGNDFLDGGAGADTMTGGLGNDAYYIDEAGDTIIELAGEGTDEVRSSIAYDLTGTFLENLLLLGAANINGTGNAVNNAITGNTGNNTLVGGAGDDTLDGGLGADTMIGGTQNDTYFVDNAGDVVTELNGEGYDTVRSTVSFSLGVQFLEKLVLLGTANINGTGNGLNNEMFGNSGNNVLDGGLGADTMVGRLGDDTYFVDNAGDVVTEASGEGSDLVQSSIAYALGANVERLTLLGSGNLNGTGNGLNNILTGNSGVNTLNGGAGNDTLDGGLGADTMIGGLGDDNYVVDNAGDVVTEASGEGNDLVQSSITYTLGANVERLTLLGNSNLNGTGNTLNNYLTGNSGNNTLSGLGGNDTIDGGLGADAMSGGLGGDTYFVDNAGDTVTEANEDGHDTVRSTVSFNLSGQFLEDLVLLGSANLSGTGNGLSNVITGNSGANVLTGGGGNDALSGGLGADTMAGGIGDDNYYVDDAGDVVMENAGEGNDAVFSTITYNLTGLFVEVLWLSGSANINATGNGFANSLVGNSGDNVLDGLGGADRMSGDYGDDTYYVDDAGDTVTEENGAGYDTVRSTVSFNLSGQFVENLLLLGSANINGTGNGQNNMITGNSGANALSGGGGSDTLDGGLGVDSMAGGLGDDIFYVDNAGDTALEATGEGTDTVRSTVSFNLSGQFLEALVLLGAANINATGNGQVNTLTGNSGNNILDGLGGADSMSGGLGDDTYFVDNAGDAVTEANGAGYDTVRTTVSFNLSGQFLEKLVLLGASNINGTGNGMANDIFGNTGVNVLSGGGGNDVIDGGAGADSMSGGTGDDIFYVDNAGDTVAEANAEGTDTVNSTVNFNLSGQFLENLVLTGSAGLSGTGNGLNNIITGNTGANILNGGGGDDVLSGGLGADTLTGAAGLDRFRFADALGGGNVDTIADYAVGQDKIELDDAIFTALGLGTLTAAAFYAGAAAHDGDDRIIYNSATGALYYDADGNGAGAAVQFAQIATGLGLGNGDFLVI